MMLNSNHAPSGCAMNRALASLVGLKFVACGVHANADPLVTHSLAFNDGVAPDGDKWRGTTPYDSRAGLAGTVDWAVFGPWDFTTAFPDSSYTPSAGELVYAYQIPSMGANAPTSLAIFNTTDWRL